MAELKPCPFCGGTAKLYREQGIGGFNGSIVRCEKCGAKAAWKQMSYTYACDREAIDAWNRRAKDEQASRMDDLISKLSEIRSEYNCFDEDEEQQYRALSETIKILSQLRKL